MKELFLLHLSDIFLLCQVCRHGSLGDITNTLTLRLLRLVNILVLLEELTKIVFTFVPFCSWGDEDIIIITMLRRWGRSGYDGENLGVLAHLVDFIERSCDRICNRRRRVYKV
jgi:hypothetical protein